MLAQHDRCVITFDQERVKPAVRVSDEAIQTHSDVVDEISHSDPNSNPNDEDMPRFAVSCGRSWPTAGSPAALLRGWSTASTQGSVTPGVHRHNCDAPPQRELVRGRGRVC